MTQYAPIIGRILLGLLFLIAGISKCMDLNAAAALVEAGGLPFPMILAVIAAVIEIGAATLLILGYKSRYAASVLVIYTLATIIFFDLDVAGSGQINFLQNLAIMGGLLYAVAYGSGGYALDAKKNNSIILNK